MSIYIFSILSGYEMGGVDAAQARRGKMLEKSGEKVTYVFTDVPDEYYIRRYRNLGISDDKMLSAHAFLTGKTELSGRFSASDYIAKYQRVIPNLKVIREENGFSSLMVTSARQLWNLEMMKKVYMPSTVTNQSG